MVETCLSVDDTEMHDFEFPCSTLSVSSTMNLSSSMSSLILGSPNDKDTFSTCESLKNLSIAGNYASTALNSNCDGTKRNSQSSITKQRSLKYKSSTKK